ncbi:hypothetical protein PV327_004009 [Microctonus hyperodae]|uniref:Uncharacterized protein n=1 Tax=Microctonus hyperodae TaxID=165561 RepID=A0AA39G558_MICHY|nr:hypothetical protein PV327_004009 [Microctonus hyperodae]
MSRVIDAGTINLAVDYGSSSSSGSVVVFVMNVTVVVDVVIFVGNGHGDCVRRNVRISTARRSGGNWRPRQCSDDEPNNFLLDEDSQTQLMNLFKKLCEQITTLLQVL